MVYTISVHANACVSAPIFASCAFSLAILFVCVLLGSVLIDYLLLLVFFSFVSFALF